MEVIVLVVVVAVAAIGIALWNIHDRSRDRRALDSLKEVVDAKRDELGDSQYREASSEATEETGDVEPRTW